ncbi:taste receptor type 2 member 8-like [Mantella aurantiaca]
MGIDPNSPATVAFLTVIAFWVVTGISMNLYILNVILKKAFQKKCVQSGDAIRAAMIGSNIFLTIMLVLGFFSYVLLPEAYHTLSFLVLLFSIYGISSSLYLTAVFCFFLFIKIVQLKSGVLAWVKRKVSFVFPRFVVAVEVFSFCCSFLSFLVDSIHRDIPKNSSAVSTANLIGKGLGGQMVFVLLTLFLVPYVLMAMTTILTAGSLVLHSHKMRSVAGSVSTKAYKNTVCKIIAFFISHTLFCFVIFFAYFSGLFIEDPRYWAILMMAYILCPANSVILIYSNNKLRRTWKRMIACIVCCKSLVQAENT